MGYYKNYAVTKYAVAPQYAEPNPEVKDLIAGKLPLGVSCDGALRDDTLTEYFNSTDFSRLTDGIKPESPSYLDPAFVHFTTGIGRSIVYRLDALSRIDGIEMGFLREDTVAVRLPRRVNVLLSPDGIKWQKAVKAKGIASAKSEECVTLKVDFEHPIAALYVVFEIDVAMHIWIDRLCVYGSELITPETLEVVQSPEEEMKPIHVNKYPEYSDFLGVHNLLLAYNCVPPEYIGENRLGYATVEHYLPHLGYINKDGVMTDTLFDGFLFLPYSRYTYSKLYKCADGWKYYIDNVFAPDANMDALNKATAIAGEKLGIKDYKVKVFLSVLSSKVHYGDFPEKFGSFDGGRDLDLDTFEDRKTALKWCIDEELRRYKEGGYTNTELGGFYWFEEDINYSDMYEVDLIAFVKDYLHSLGYILFWIPYYQASGFRDWQENGFDIACMQPNYAFNKKIEKQRLYDNAETSKLLGLCVELEIGGLTEEDAKRFHEYMDCGAETGYMNTVKMYYQGGIPGEFYKSYQSDDPYLRSVYDDLYLFAKEKYVSKNKR